MRVCLLGALVIWVQLSQGEFIRFIFFLCALHAGRVLICMLQLEVLLENAIKWKTSALEPQPPLT